MAGTFTIAASFSGKGSATAAAKGAFSLGLSFSAAPVEQLPACRFLTLSALEAAAGGRANLDRLFDYNGDGRADPIPLALAMRGAEDHALSYLLGNWSEDEVSVIGRTDYTFRQHVAFVALEIASEQKTAFAGQDGKGRFWAQYERANEYFDRMKKNKAKTTASTKGAGAGAQSGGEISPRLEPATAPRFTFVPDRNNRSRGGY